MHYLRSVTRTILCLIVIPILGCAAGEPFLQQVVDKEGKVVIESRKWNIQTRQIFVVHRSISGEISFFQISEAEFRAAAWFTWDLRANQQRPAGMSAVGVKAERYIKQGSETIGEPVAPYFDDQSNPFYGVSLNKTTQLQRTYINLPISPPNNTPSVWRLEQLPIQKEARDKLRLSNMMVNSAFINRFKGGLIKRSSGREVIPRYFISANTPLGFLIEQIAPQNFRLIAFTEDAKD